MRPEAACPKCEGCGRIANSEDGEPWRFWEKLPWGNDAAVRLGYVKPIPCPCCGGSGVARKARSLADRFCWLCERLKARQRKERKNA